jgi:hypothetical protein
MTRLSRRGLLAAGVAAGVGGAVRPLAALADAPVRKLAVFNLHTGERLQAAYWEAGAYLPDALTAFDRVLRDHRTGEVHAIAPSILDLTAALLKRLDVRRCRSSQATDRPDPTRRFMRRAPAWRPRACTCRARRSISASAAYRLRACATWPGRCRAAASDTTRLPTSSTWTSVVFGAGDRA